MLINNKREIDELQIFINLKPLRWGNTIKSLLKEGEHSTSHITTNTIILDISQLEVSSLYIGFIHTTPWVSTMGLSIPYI